MALFTFWPSTNVEMWDGSKEMSLPVIRNVVQVAPIKFDNWGFLL
jgi:hypothetical protein